MAISGQPVAEGCDDPGEFVGRPRGLDEKHIRTSLRILPRPVDRCCKALDGNGIGARDNQRLRAAPAVDSRLELADHLRRGNQALFGKVPAALGIALVLDLQGIGPCPLEGTHRALHVQGVAIAVVRIDDQRRRHPVADQANGFSDLGHRYQPDVRPAKTGIGDGGARQVDRLEAGIRRQQRGQRIIDAGCEQQCLL